MLQVSINLTLKQGLFSPPLKFRVIEKRSNFCLDQNALGTPREHEEFHEVDEAIQPEFAAIQYFLDRGTTHLRPCERGFRLLVLRWVSPPPQV